MSTIPEYDEIMESLDCARTCEMLDHYHWTEPFPEESMTREELDSSIVLFNGAEEYERTRDLCCVLYFEVSSLAAAIAHCGEECQRDMGHMQCLFFGPGGVVIYYMDSTEHFLTRVKYKFV